MTKEKITKEEKPKVTDPIKEEVIDKTPDTTEKLEENNPELKKETIKLKEEDKSFEIIDGKKFDKALMAQARFEGWRGKDFLKKVEKDDKYLDPDVFIERGRKSVPFLHKKIDKLQEENHKKIEKIQDENNSLKNILQNQIKTQLNDRIEKIDGKLKDAKDYGEFDNVEKMLRKKIDLESELKTYDEQKKKEVQQPNQTLPLPPKEMVQWELDNKWVYEYDEKGNENKEYDKVKTKKAQDLFDRLSISYPRMTLKDRFELIDENLNKDESIKSQKRNLAPPVASSGSSAKSPQVTRNISNLNSFMKKQYEDFCKDVRGKKWTGKDLENYKKNFLASCNDKHFI